MCRQPSYTQEKNTDRRRLFFDTIGIYTGTMYLQLSTKEKQKNTCRLVREHLWSGESENSLVLLLDLWLGSWQWELNVVIGSELQVLSSSQIWLSLSFSRVFFTSWLSSVDDNSLDDVNVLVLGSVSGSHLNQQLVNSTDKLNISVFLVHVGDAGSAVISDPDTKVLDVIGGLLWDFGNVQNFTVGLLELVVDLGVSSDKVPESALGNNSVWSKDSHFVESWLVGGGLWSSSTNNFIVLNLGRNSVL